MAFIRPARFIGVECPTSPGAIYTVPVNTRVIIKSIDIANNGSGAAAVTLWLVPSGGSAGADTLLIPTVSIAKNTIFQWTGTQVLHAAGAIHADTDISGVTITVSGGEYI